MDLKSCKLGVGPMSLEIIDIIRNYDKIDQLMIVASRNQVDFDNGYVCATKELAELLKGSHIALCRDHCGPYFSDKDKNLSLRKAVSRCKETINADIENDFRLIHIDISRVSNNKYKVAEELFEFALDLNPGIKFEFGSEENTGSYFADYDKKILEEFAFLEQYKNNLEFYVFQTGSLVKHTQVGSFDIDYNKTIAELIHDRGLRFKEHNADYLDSEQITKRRIAGVDALNIAPQLGVLQTKLLRALGGNTTQWALFENLVYSNKQWQRWISYEVAHDRDTCVDISGHYFFDQPQYFNLVNAIDYSKYRHLLRKQVTELLDLYLSP